MFAPVYILCSSGTTANGEMGHFLDHIEARCVMCYRLLLVLTIMSKSGPLRINCWMIGTPLPRIATITLKDRNSRHIGHLHLTISVQRRYTSGQFVSPSTRQRSTSSKGKHLNLKMNS